MDDSQINSLTIKGLFGPIVDIASSRELIDQGYLAELKIKTILLKYPRDITKHFRKISYQQEVEWLCKNQRRNKLIKDLCRSLEGNTMVLYRYVDGHGRPLYDLLKNNITDYPVHFISGEVEKEDRENIRRIINDSQKCLVVASEGTFGEGINIPNLDNLVFASPSKSRIKTMQRIGRGARRTETKAVCNLFDIADDLSPSPKKLGFTMRHYLTRVKYYMEEKFNFDQTRIELYDWYSNEVQQ
jgi:superfamily II DNA or RNA helicase